LISWIDPHPCKIEEASRPCIVHKVGRRGRGRQQLMTRSLPVRGCGVGGRASADRNSPQGGFRVHAPVSPSPRAPAGEPREAGRKEFGRTCVREKAAINKHPLTAWRSCSASFCEFLSPQPFLHPVPPRLLLKPHPEFAHGAVRRHSPALSPQLTLGCRTFFYNAGVTARPLPDDARPPTLRTHTRTTRSTGQQIVRITRRPGREPLAQTPHGHVLGHLCLCGASELAYARGCDATHVGSDAPVLSVVGMALEQGHPGAAVRAGSGRAGRWRRRNPPPFRSPAAAAAVRNENARR
jgi:hypothetical protein